MAEEATPALTPAPTPSPAPTVGSVAVYAAVLATISFGWQVYQYWDSRPKLEVDFVQGSYLRRDTTKTALADRSHPLVAQPTIRFSNRGSKPLSVYLVIVETELDSPAFLRQELYGGRNSWDDGPFKLDAGEVREWKPTLTFIQGGRNLPDEFTDKATVRVTVGSTEGYVELDFPAELRYYKNITEPRPPITPYTKK